jgi:hypothetical protein
MTDAEVLEHPKQYSRFSHPNSWFALWMFLKLGAPRLLLKVTFVFFLCVCFCCWIFDAAGSKGDGEKNKALEDGIGAFGASHLPLEIQQWTLFNFFGSFVYEHILILDHILDKFGSINQFWPNVMEYQMRVRIQ